MDPLGAGRKRVRERKLGNWNRLSRAATPADRYNLFIVHHVNTLDCDRCAENLRGKGDCESLVQQRIESGTLLRFGICIDDRLLNQGDERCFRGRPTLALPSPSVCRHWVFLKVPGRFVIVLGSGVKFIATRVPVPPKGGARATLNRLATI